MKYRLTQHARQRMAERGVSFGLVETVLQSPGQVVSVKDGKKAYQSQVESAGWVVLVRLIVDDTAEPVVVVSVIKTTKIAQYWQKEGADDEGDL